MKQLYVVLKVVSALVGVFLLACGVLWLYIGATHRTNEGQTAILISSGAFIAIALVLIAFPFSLILAKKLGVIVLSLFALGMLWLVFAPDSIVHRPSGSSLAVQAAAIAFAILLAFRMWNSFRRPKNQTGA